MEVGTQTLSTNVYENDRNGLLSEVQYGNGGKVKYTYDDFDRLTGVRHDAETADRYTYEYGANGQAARVHDNNLNRTYETEYDLSDRPCRGTLRDTDGTAIYRTTLEYTRHSNLNRFREELSDGWTKDTYETSYAYDIDNRVTEMQFDDSAHKVAYTYDELGRINARTLTNGTASYLTTYTFVTGGYGTNSTTPLVSGITQGSGENAMNFAYAYDSRGNITSETRNGKVITYTYDALGQLIRVNDPNDTTAGESGTTWLYNYDRGGNITSKSYYAYTTGTPGTAMDTITYSYTDSNWKDKLTACDGQTITYDAIGNPLNDGTWTYTWEKGRQLKQMSAEGTSVSFKYDHNGLRVQKVVEQDWYPETTNYTLRGKLITHMTVDYTDGEEVTQQDSLHFFYDAQSRPAMVNFNGTLYSYVHNLQGDIVGILDSSGSLVVEYKYDAWGKLLSTTGALADTLGKRNPFRYRGYAYDEETGLYHMPNRYYSPVLMRFMTIDSIFESVAFTPTPHNVYLYTRNNVISTVDRNGNRTYAFTLGGTIGLFVGYSFSLTYAWDDEGNSGWYLSHGPILGLVIEASGSFSFQITEADTLKEYEGSSANMGFTPIIKPKGAEWDMFKAGFSAAGDLAFLNDVDNLPDGFQVSISYGIGADLFHIGMQETILLGGSDIKTTAAKSLEPYSVTPPPPSTDMAWLETFYDPATGLYFEVPRGVYS